MYRIDKKLLGVAMLHAGVRSAKDLAILSGVSVNTISRMNNGGKVKLDTVLALSKALGMEPEEILKGE